MLLAPLTHAFQDHMIGNEQPTIILMGDSAFILFLEAIALLQRNYRDKAGFFYDLKEPRFNGTPVIRDSILTPTSVRFIVPDGASSEYELQANGDLTKITTSFFPHPHVSMEMPK